MAVHVLAPRGHASQQGLGLQGNELSYYMLMASSFVMNHAERAGQWALFPYVLNTCNQRADADQLRQVAIAPCPHLDRGPGRPPYADSLQPPRSQERLVLLLHCCAGVSTAPSGFTHTSAEVVQERPSVSVCVGVEGR